MPHSAQTPSNLRRRSARTGTKLAHQSLFAAEQALKDKWGGRRGAKSDASQLRKGLDTLLEAIGAPPEAGRTLTPADVTEDQLDYCLEAWEADGLAPTTINRRLMLLGMLGVIVKEHWVSGEARLKWWLNPTDCERLLRHLREERPCQNAETLADYIEWASHVGMRVEETLRLTWADVVVSVDDDGQHNASEVTVPGTKNSHSQANLALASRPALVLKRLQAARPERQPGDRIFPVTYKQLLIAWQHARAFLGATDNPLATLRALRRTAARHLTVNGMPTAIVQRYLRHSNIQTTMGYLRLVGGYSTEEQRKWL